MSDIEIKNDEIDILKFISIIVINIKYVIGITSVFAIIVVIYALVSLKLPADKSYLPNEYSPKSTVMLSSSNGGMDSALGGSGLGALAGLAGLSGSGGGSSDLSLAMKLVTTNRFINNLVQEFKLDEVYKTKDSKYPKNAIRTVIKGNLKLTVDEGSGMLEISYTDVDKFLATDIVNSVTEFLEAEFLAIDKVRNINQFANVSEKIIKIDKELEKLQSKIIDFQIENNMMDVEIVSAAIVEQITNFQTQLLEKEVQIDSYGKISNIKDPGYIRLINERDAINNALKKLENGEVGDFPAVKDLPILALNLEKLKQDVQVKQVAYMALIQQAETLKLTAEGTGSTFQPLEDAEIPEIKSGPSRAKLCIKYTFVGFVLSIFFIYLKEVLVILKKNPNIIKRLKGEM